MSKNKGRGFSFGGFALSSSFHKPGQLPAFQKERKESGGGWGGKGRSNDDCFNDASDESDDGVGGESEDAIKQRISREFGYGEGESEQREEEDEEDDDPLEAFMAGLENEIKSQEEKGRAKKEKEKRSIRDDIEEEDDQESYFKAMANAPIVVAEGDEEIEVEYDSDGNPMVSEKSRVIDPLPPLDHSMIDYASFNRNFYEEHKEITSLTKQELYDLKKKLCLKVTGYSPIRPCVSFAHFGFDEELLAVIKKSGFAQPTPIQAQAIPTAMSGRDVIGIAKTGSGKTAAFLWPLLVHAMDQPELKEGEGPIGLICAPTRELCQQIYHEARKFAKAYSLRVLCVYGGGSKWEQSRALKEGCDILVATPGRLIDLVKIKAMSLEKVTYLVFDEADRMFDMGFEPQVRSIANHVRPDRQTLLFSATFRKKVERLCRDCLTDPMRILVGDLGEANTDISQIVEVMKDEHEKWAWLKHRLVEFTSSGSVLIFVTRKVNSEEVATSLRGEGHKVGLLHGDMSQGDRDSVISAFKKKEFLTLVATDVAARGLDIPSIKTVVNFDVSKDVDTHVHRIGRTGRAGEKGTAFTLVTSKDSHFAGDLVRNLEVADQRVSPDLMALAMQNTRFQRSRQKHGGKRRGGGGGGGRMEGRGRGSGGYRVRPGLGATSETMSTFSKGSTVSVEKGPLGPSPSPSSLGPMGSLVGPGGSKASIMKSTYLNQYKMRFTQATSSSFSSTSSLKGKPKPPAEGEVAPPATKKKRRSRWD